MRILTTLLGSADEFMRAVNDRGAVYVIRAGNTAHLKIGHSFKPRSRIAELQIGSSERLRPVALIAGSPEVEAVLHRQYDEWHLRGEWFDDCYGVILLQLKAMTNGEMFSRAIWTMSDAKMKVWSVAA